MKALIRNEGETVRETDGIVGIDWMTGAPLTNPTWEGGKPYRLVENYIEYDNEEVAYEDAETPLEVVEEPKEPAEEKYTFNGKEYTAKELKELLGSL